MIASLTSTVGAAVYPSIESSVRDIIKTPWAIKDGNVVPETEDLVMKNGGRLIDATYLYADMADSSTIAQTLHKEVAAKMIRAFVNSATRILRAQGGEIRSFDGDRVMAIFIGDDKNWNAVRAAFAINWAVVEVVRPAVKENWDWSGVSGKPYNIGHRVGIDTGEALIVRGGARDNNDLISIGAAPNVGAKLSDLKNGYETYITDRVYSDLEDDALLLVEDSYGRKKSSWTKLYRTVEIGGSYHTVYGSNVYWEV